MSRLKTYVIIAVLSGLGLLIFIPGRQLAREHVNERTAVTDHPLLCTSCHIPISKNKLITRIINADYFSPFNLAVDNKNRWMYVVAQDTDELLKVDIENKKVVEKIKVGDHPHSVIIDEKAQRAYVSNEWSDTVSIIDLLSFEIVESLKRETVRLESCWTKKKSFSMLLIPTDRMFQFLIYQS